MAPVLRLPVVAAPVTDKVPNCPSPVVWMVPLPAFKEVPVIPAKLAAPEELI